MTSHPQLVGLEAWIRPHGAWVDRKITSFLKRATKRLSDHCPVFENLPFVAVFIDASVVS